VIELTFALEALRKQVATNASQTKLMQSVDTLSDKVATLNEHLEAEAKRREHDAIKAAARAEGEQETKERYGIPDTQRVPAVPPAAATPVSGLTDVTPLEKALAATPHGAVAVAAIQYLKQASTLSAGLLSLLILLWSLGIITISW